MDVVRRCYVTKMRLWKDDPTEVEVRWFRCDESAGHYNGYSPFRSFSTWNRGEPFRALGERKHAKATTYDKGFNLYSYRGDHIDGSLAAVERGGIHGVDEPIETNADGTTENCGVSLVFAPLVMTSWPRGDGWIVCLGGASLIRAWDENFGIYPDWNDGLWQKVAAWIGAEGGPGARGAGGYAADWPVPYLYPTVSGLAAIVTEGGSDSELLQLENALENVRVLWTGFSQGNFDLQDHQFHPRAWPVLARWVTAGGFLFVVGKPWPTLWVDRNNDLLTAMEADIEFFPPPYGRFAPVQTWLTFTGVDTFHNLGDPWVNPAGILPDASSSTHQTLTLPFPADLLSVFCYTPHNPGPGVTGITVELLARQSGWAGGDGYLIVQIQPFFFPSQIRFVQFPLPASDTWVAFGGATDAWEPHYQQGAVPFSFGIVTQSVPESGTVTLSAIRCRVIWRYPGIGQYQEGETNLNHPALSYGEGTAPTAAGYQSCQKLAGGIWIVKGVDPV